MTTIPIGSTEQARLITVVVNGVNLGAFQSYSGGDTTAKVTKSREGGMGTEVPYPGLPSYSDMKVSRVNQAQRDWELVRSLKPMSGRVTGSVTIQPLDTTGNAYGNSQTATGLFLGVSGTKGTSDSEAPSKYDLDFSITSWS